MSSPRDETSRRPSTSRPSRRAPSRLENVRIGINQLFTGRSTVGLSRNQAPESPKTPRLALGLQNLPSTRINIPHLNRTASTSSNGSTRSNAAVPRSARNPLTPFSSRPITPRALRQATEGSTDTTIPPPVQRSSTRRFIGVDPAELHLAELAQSGRRRRRQKSRKRHAERRCAPKIKSRKIRAKILSCFVSGLFLTLVLTVYLALALSNRNESQEFHVLLILIILVTTIFFCHSLIRLCMMIIHPPADDVENQNLPSMIGPGGYANPVMPIRVALVRDEEAAGIESDATKFPPPAYGLWRESVRVDPNRIFWQRNEEAALEHQNYSSGTEERPSTTHRPPSYVSEDGVDYVIEAAPRSIAPTTDIPLLQHPSERGRLWPMP